MTDIKKPSNAGVLACYLKGGDEISTINVREVKAFLDNTPISERESMAKQLIDDGSVIVVDGKPKFAHN